MNFERVVGEELFIRCPACGSLDTRQHYNEDNAACNNCGYVFLSLLGGLPYYNESEDEESDDDD